MAFQNSTQGDFNVMLAAEVVARWFETTFEERTKQLPNRLYLLPIQIGQPNLPLQHMTVD